MDNGENLNKNNYTAQFLQTEIPLNCFIKSKNAMHDLLHLYLRMLISYFSSGFLKSNNSGNEG